MSKNLDQIYVANPTTTIGNNDLMYIMQSPYTSGTDAGITGASLKSLFAQSSQVQANAFNFAAATGVNDAFVVTLSPAPASLTDGLLVTMNSGTLSNLTTTPTLKLNSFPAESISTFAGAPSPGDIQTGSEYLFIYNASTNKFQLINPSSSTADTGQVQTNGYNYALDTGVANAYIANILPVQLTTISGLEIIMTAVNANTGASTLTVNGVTNPILLSNGAVLTGGEILVNGIYQFFYSAALTAYVLTNSSSVATTSQIINWAANSNSSISAAVNKQYILTSGSPTTVTLPTTFAVGKIIGVQGSGAAWTVNIGASTNVQAFGNTFTTSIASANNTDSIVLIGLVANTTWGILSSSSVSLTAS